MNQFLRLKSRHRIKQSGVSDRFAQFKSIWFTACQQTLGHPKVGFLTLEVIQEWAKYQKPECST